MRRPGARVRFWAAGVVALAIAAPLGSPAVAADVTTSQGAKVITPAFFGVNPGRKNLNELPSDSFGALRLWDTDTTWCSLQPTPALITRETLDAKIGPYIEKAKRDGYRAISVVLGHPPNWVFQTRRQNPMIPAAWANESPPSLPVRTNTPAPGGSFVCKGKYGGSQIPVFEEGGHNHTNFLMYATAVMSYVKSELAGTNIQRQFEVWNEIGERNSLNPNQGGFGNIATDPDSADRAARSLIRYTAVVKQLSRDTPETSSTSGGLVLSASMFVPDAHITESYLRDLNAYPSVVDAVNIHSYFETETPKMIAKVRSYPRLARKPLYLTEMSESPGPTREAVSEASITARSIANSFYYNISGVYWYGWMRPSLNLVPLSPGSPAVNAVASVRKLLVGLQRPQCSESGAGVRQCTFLNPADESVRGTLLWTAETSHSRPYVAPAFTKFVSAESGDPIAPPTRITASPVFAITTTGAFGGSAGLQV